MKASEKKRLPHRTQVDHRGSNQPSVIGLIRSKKRAPSPALLADLVDVRVPEGADEDSNELIAEWGTFLS